MFRKTIWHTLVLVVSIGSIECGFLFLNRTCSDQIMDATQIQFHENLC